MEKSSKGTGRRTLLQRGLALLAGGAAVASGARLTRGTRAAAADAPLVVYARRRPFAGPPNGTHHASATSAVLASGDLLDAPEGKAIGSFHTNCFCHGAIGSHQVVKPSLEFQVLQLKDGTLYGIFAGESADGVKSHAIVGGTGRFAGARGQYMERMAAGQTAGDDIVQFVVSLAV